MGPATQLTEKGRHQLTTNALTTWTALIGFISLPMNTYAFRSREPIQYLIDGKVESAAIMPLKSVENHWGIFLSSGYVHTSAGYATKEEAMTAWYNGFTLMPPTSPHRRKIIQHLVEAGHLFEVDTDEV